MKTKEPQKRPWEYLPAPIPKTHSPPLGEFYERFARPLIADTVRMMCTGLPIDLDKVRELEATLDVTIKQVHDTLLTNPIIKQYQEQRYEHLKKAYIADRKSKCKDPSDYIKPFKHNDMNHRSYFMQVFTENVPLPQPTDLLPTGIPKWTAKDVKAHSSKTVLKKLLEGSITESNNKYAAEAVRRFAKAKADIYNKKFLQQAQDLDFEFPPFNPGSPDQKHDVLTSMLGYESNKLTDAYEKYDRAMNAHIKYGKPEPTEPKNKFSWDRENIENLQHTAKNENEKALFQALIDYSMGSIIKNNFIKAFYEYTVDGRLYGQYKLLGAKTGRYTSSNPNMLNSPSTGSIYAKPVKKCFIAPPGYKVWTIDYASLT